MHGGGAAVAVRQGHGGLAERMGAGDERVDRGPVPQLLRRRHYRDRLPRVRAPDGLDPYCRRHRARDPAGAVRLHHPRRERLLLADGPVPQLHVVTLCHLRRVSAPRHRRDHRRRGPQHGHLAGGGRRCHALHRHQPHPGHRCRRELQQGPPVLADVCGGRVLHRHPAAVARPLLLRREPPSWRRPSRGSQPLSLDQEPTADRGHIS
mmetsp:Transcript_16392/g.39324  ORF Transcript_16392/g.39324 Transcript_16392/m.39324 type:complete len:207 (+) Transcript_16392:2591-3211(+)